jgi:ligand-binding sensor protein
MVNSKKKLEDYFDIDKVKSVFENHSKKMQGIWLSLFDSEETIYIDMDVQDVCNVFHRVNKQTADLCNVCNKELLRKYYNLEYAEYKCGNDLLNITMPIKLNDEHIATFSTGQFFIKGEHEAEVDKFKARAKKFDFNETEYLKLYQKMPTYTREQINEFLTEIKREILALLKK